MALYEVVLRMAHEHPEIRRHLVPILRQARSYQDYVDDKKKSGEKPLSKDDWEARTQGGSSSSESKPEASKFEDAHADGDFGMTKDDLDGFESVMSKSLSKDFAATSSKKLRGLNETVEKFSGYIQTARRGWKEVAEDLAKDFDDHDIERARDDGDSKAADAMERLRKVKSLDDVDLKDVALVKKTLPEHRHSILDRVESAHARATDLHQKREKAHTDLMKEVKGLKAYIQSKGK